MQEHRHIGLNCIPYHIADLQRNTVRIIKSGYRTVIPDANIQFAAMTVSKSNAIFQVIELNLPSSAKTDIL